MIKRIVASVLLLFLLTGCSSLRKATETRDLMGTYVTITVMHENKTYALEQIGKAFKEIERIDGLLSNYKNTSEAYFLNENGYLTNISDDMMVNLKKSLYYSDLSEGAFDITVQPILDLYKDSFENKKRAPTDEEIKEALKLVDYNKIWINYRNVSFRKKGMKITLGGIAKGYAVDRAIDVLTENKIENALVNAGGDLRAIGLKGRKEWEVALQNPRNKKEYITLIALNNRAVATSGDYERYFDESKKFHHIINPKTGYSATELISVTIIADTAIEADALATSVFVLGKEKGLALIEKLPAVEGLLITKDREMIKSSGFVY